MYNPQQLYQFIQYAKQYLESEDFEFKSGDTLLNPNNEDDLTRLISIALAEHRDGDRPTGFATNNDGDEGRSRGPWQIYGSTWESVLREYDIFNAYDNINDALDDPGLNAIAALIVAQYDVGDRTGITNWTTDEISGRQEFLDAAKDYDTQTIENPTQIQNPDGTVEEIPTEPTVEGYENMNTGLMEQPEQTIKSMKRALMSASKGGLYKNDEYYVSYQGNRVRENQGSTLNNMTRNMFAGMDIDTLDDSQIVKMYAEVVHPYLPFDPEYRGVGLKGDGQNLVDLLQNKKFKSDDNYYIPSQGKVVKGKELNQRLNMAKSTMYQYYINNKGSEPSQQIYDVFEYIFRTVHPYIKVDENFEVGNTPDTTIRSPGTGFPVNRGQYLEEFNNTMFPKRPGQNLGEGMPEEAAPTFLNNLEKILRIKPQGNNMRNQNNERNSISGFFD